jgi:prolycopene isomerase
MKKWDVVVIGAGLGGLSAATRLARAGRKVLLLERHAVPGGYATSFVRGRFEFEVALHALSGMGTADRPGSTWRYLESIGVASRIGLIRLPDAYRSVLPGADVVVPAGREAAETRLCEAFPRDADGIRRFLGRVFDLQAEVADFEARLIGRPPGLDVLLAAPLRMPTALRYLPATVSQVLDRDVGSPEARGVLSQYWAYFGLPPSRLSFLYFAVALASYIRDGATYVRGRSQALSNAFVAAFEEAGGEVRTGCGARSIRVRDGRVVGVITDRDEDESADEVVSNASPVATCRELIDPKHVPPAYYDTFRNATIGPSCVNVYLGLGRSLDELGVRDHETFVTEDLDVDRVHDLGATLEPPKGIAVAAYNAVYPEISPAGSSIVSLTALYRGEPWQDLEPGRYAAVKHRIADRMLAMAEQVIPGLRACAEVVSVSTPLTNERYTGNPLGAIYGFDQPPWFSTILRPGPAGPVPGLSFAGAWVQPGGGFEPCILSGRAAAERILSGRREG